METTKFIVIAFLALAAGGTPPGLINTSVAKTALEKDKKNGIYAAWGVFTANFIQSFVCILLAKYISRRITIKADVLKIAVFVFAILAIYFFIASKRNKTINRELTKKDSHKSFVKGFLVANINVLLIPSLIFLATQLHRIVPDAYEWPYVFLYAFSTASGTLTVLYVYIYAILKLEKRTNLIAKYANYFMGCLMVVLFIITLIRLIYVG